MVDYFPARFYPRQLDTGDWGVCDQAADPQETMDDFGPYDTRELAYLAAATLNTADDKGLIN